MALQRRADDLGWRGIFFERSIMIRGMQTNREYVRRYAVLIPTMLDSRIWDLIYYCEYGRIVDLCRAELRRREQMDAP